MTAGEFTGRTAVVTSARDMIGSAVVARLAALGASVIAVDRTPRAARDGSAGRRIGRTPGGGRDTAG
ncbi:hypothetical protein [Streptomyces apocyni]|uniref:hypothetical protein n=1 Tax=Streptomyces apocyni TaxID=2654677 RepID=UPI0012EAD862|nr:hypothetical protein [Streptomyces apocyni]